MPGSGRNERQSPLNFATRTASTGILADDNTYFEKGEFELTLKAEVGPANELKTSLDEGYWACRCVAKIGREIQSREILLASSSWDKLGKFKANLRKAFVGANMWIEFTPKELSAYYKYLKEMYRSRGERHFYLVEVLGRQPDTDYWVFSRERRNKKVENAMILCEAHDKDVCPGKGYFHKRCLGLPEVPKESPWGASITEIGGKIHRLYFEK